MHGAMHLAQQKGWFAEQGLNVDIQDGTGTINTLQLLAAGKVDVGQVSLGTMAVAKEHGLDLISIAGFARTGDLAVMTGKTLNVKTPKDLIGKKIVRSEEHTSELQSLMRISYAVFCLKK